MILNGDLLISNISLAQDYIFRRSVVLICDSDNNRNPMGFIINKPLKINLSDVISKVNKKIRLHFGGPVSSETLFCVHKSELKLKSSKRVTKYLNHGCDLNEIIYKCNNGELNKDNTIFFLGYSGWSYNQLLEEIDDNFWKINKKYSKNIFKNSDENLWIKLTKKIEGNSYLWSHSPENIADN